MNTLGEASQPTLRTYEEDEPDWNGGKVKPVDRGFRGNVVGNFGDTSERKWYENNGGPMYTFAEGGPVPGGIYGQQLQPQFNQQGAMGAMSTPNQWGTPQQSMASPGGKGAGGMPQQQPMPSPGGKGQGGQGSGPGMQYPGMDTFPTPQPGMPSPGMDTFPTPQPGMPSPGGKGAGSVGERMRLMMQQGGGGMGQQQLTPNPNMQPWDNPNQQGFLGQKANQLAITEAMQRGQGATQQPYDGQDMRTQMWDRMQQQQGQQPGVLSSPAYGPEQQAQSQGASLQELNQMRSTMLDRGAPIQQQAHNANIGASDDGQALRTQMWERMEQQKQAQQQQQQHEPCFRPTNS
jgi:hypothetical protein